ncbi:L-amino acid N-acyltransferase YncA [Klenkia soli]|uniref:L-amino acid N-acyltransferase YncA n=1 Tax=Klenkia soli TaxID=1052260 RepID=A0A1H0SBP4_9ACTN|nr:GNAT family N-acetyltransferase [Klenkia soli]SDP39174.1 L-amino acid N-acyltransferase YncA [Klenkia soli]
MQLTGRADYSVRPATPPDAPEIARVQRVTWRTAYRDLLPAVVLDEWDDAAVTARWADSVQNPPTPSHGVLVATENGVVVGYLVHGPAELPPGETPSADGPTSEVHALLVEPRWGRRGHGSRLLAAAVDVLVPTGVRRLQTWVPDADHVTAGFLESAGWAADGWTRSLDAGATTIHEQRWHALLVDDEGLA